MRSPKPGVIGEEEGGTGASPGPLFPAAPLPLLGFQVFWSTWSLATVLSWSSHSQDPHNQPILHNTFQEEGSVPFLSLGVSWAFSLSQAPSHLFPSPHDVSNLLYSSSLPHFNLILLHEFKPWKQGFLWAQLWKQRTEYCPKLSPQYVKLLVSILHK